MRVLIPRRVEAALFWTLSASLLSCASTSSTTPSCSPGRTALDGVCVREDIADYVSCVRAQGARLDSESSKKLAAEAGIAGTRAGVLSETSDRLEKSYAVSDQAILEVIRGCREIQADSSTEILAAPGQDRFGAIAVSDSSGRFGWTVDRPSRAVAERAAVRRCAADDCRSIVWFVNACGAVSRDSAGKFYYGGGQPTREDAESRAKTECESQGTGCSAFAWACSSQP